MSKRIGPVVVCLAALLVLNGCLFSSSAPKDQLEYNGPSEQTVPRGEMLPATDIQYVGNTADGAQVLIAGQQAIKKVGDSLDWQGNPVPGVKVSLSQRVLHSDDANLVTAGTVQIVVDGVAPAEGQYPNTPLYSYKVPVIYTIQRGNTIPGTLITYKGKASDGAELSGVSGYPYRRLGDSISWRGRLRANVYIDMTVRVVAYTDGLMQVTGLATIGLTQE